MLTLLKLGTKAINARFDACILKSNKKNCCYLQWSLHKYKRFPSVMQLFYESHAYVLGKLAENYHWRQRFPCFFFVVAFLLLLKFRVRPQALEDIQNERNGPGDDVGDSCNLIGSQRT